MQYTENLGLPVLEDTDTMNAVFTQGNGISNQLETALGGYTDDFEALPDLRSDMSTAKTDIDNLETTVGNQGTAIGQLQSTTDGLVDSVTAMEEKGLGLKYASRWSATGQESYGYQSDLLFNVAGNYNSDFVNITNGVIRFKKAGKYKLTFTACVYNNTEHGSTDYSTLFRFLKNATQSGSQYIAGTEIANYRWCENSATFEVVLTVSELDTQALYYPVLTAQGGYVGYSLTADEGAQSVTIEKID